LPNKSLDFFIFGTYVYFSHKLLAVSPENGPPTTNI